MSGIEEILSAIDGLLGSAVWFPFALLGTGLFFTIYLGFPQVRYFKHAWSVLRGDHSDPNDPGDTTHFQAMSTALSGTVGTGNIAGVGLAIFLGGPAALFWMWATAFVGMTTKFVEVSLSHKYRTVDDKGHMVGGPMNYMEHRLNLKWLAAFFAIATVVSSFGSGNMPQANSMASGLEASFGIPTAASGAVLAILLGLVIIGGIRRIAIVAATLVPLMAIIYALGALAVLATHYDNVLPAFWSILSDAFTGSAAVGGFLGASFAYAFNRGVNRGLYSNEAGQGSAPIAHASAKTKEPVAEGMVSLLEPFIDTLVICTLTGLVILASGVWFQKHETDFANFDTQILTGVYQEANTQDVEALYKHLDTLGSDQRIPGYSGELMVSAGRIEPGVVTVIHNRSIAENVTLWQDGALMDGTVSVREGSIVTQGVSLKGESLLHSVPLTAKAFETSFLGAYGSYAVTLGLVLFAFTTALAWSYYGDRAITYLLGAAWVLPYRITYVLGFFLATVVDTTLVWLFSYITVALMTLPNLIGIFLLRKEVKDITNDYWSKQKSQ